MYIHGNDGNGKCTAKRSRRSRSQHHPSDLFNLYRNCSSYFSDRGIPIQYRRRFVPGISNLCRPHPGYPYPDCDPHRGQYLCFGPDRYNGKCSAKCTGFDNNNDKCSLLWSSYRYRNSHPEWWTISIYVSLEQWFH